MKLFSVTNTILLFIFLCLLVQKITTNTTSNISINKENWCGLSMIDIIPTCQSNHFSVVLNVANTEHSMLYCFLRKFGKMMEDPYLLT